MKLPYKCRCGQQTMEPYAVAGVLMCVICCESVAPDIVDSRERYARGRYQEKAKPWIRRSKGQLHW